LRECCDWYGHRWRYYHDKWEAAHARGLPGQREATFWAFQLSKWQDQLLINELPRIGFLPTYSFPVNSVQLEVITEDRPQGNVQPWERDIQLTRDARLGIGEYAPGAQVIAGGRVWESYGIGEYPRHFMPTRFYRECTNCRHVQIEEEKDDFAAACHACGRPVRPMDIRAFIEPKSFVTSSGTPTGKDPGLSRLKPPPAQEARLLTTASESKFSLLPTNVPRTTWAWQSAKEGRMFVVNRGRGVIGGGFLRCGCGFAQMLKRPDDATRIRNGSHRTPYNQPCDARRWHQEDLAHEFHTDVLQIRLDAPVPIPVGLPPEAFDGWRDAFARTLAEAVRIAATRLLGIDQRELAGTVRLRAFGPEVILYDSVAGGAGYCQMLVGRHSMRELLTSTASTLRCPADCSHACRACLQTYDNQLHWEKLSRRPVLKWLEHLLEINQPANPFEQFRAAPFEVTAGLPIVLGELERSTHLIAITPTLFVAGDGSADALGFAQKLVARLATGLCLDLALSEPPVIDPDSPDSLHIAQWIAPCAAAGKLKLWQVPRDFDWRKWPRFVTNPGRDDSRAFFTNNGENSGFLDTPLPSPIWQSPAFDAEVVAAMRKDWRPIDSKCLQVPKGVTLFDYRPGDSRQLSRDFAFCRGKSFSQIRIEDPYALSSDHHCTLLQQLLAGLGTLWNEWPPEIHLRTRSKPEVPQEQMRQRLTEQLRLNRTTFSCHIASRREAERIDLHDRRLIFQCDAGKIKKRTVVLLTGGVQRYVDQQYETTVVISSG
jgi:hypothetical protein